MTHRSEFGPLAEDEAERRGVGEMICRAFGAPLERAMGWVMRLGPGEVRVLREAGVAVAALGRIPMGQWFGGRSVPMVGISSVAVPPERRGSGAARRLLRATLEELHEEGVPLSTLYPATQTPYRRAGWEQAGARYTIELDPRRIDVADREASMRPVEEKDEKAIAELHGAYARSLAGHLDRGPFMWSRVRRPEGEPAEGYVVEAEGRLEGYVYLRRRPLAAGGFRLELSDLTASTPRAGRRLLTFLADHRSVCGEVRWNGSPTDPILALMPEQTARVRLTDHWMLRLVDVKAALEARGYPEGIRATLPLAVRDGLLPGNDGRFVLEVASGAGQITPGGAGRVSAHVRGLAPLFTGHLSPFEARRAGLLDGPESDLAHAAVLFGGPAPWLPEFF